MKKMTTKKKRVVAERKKRVQVRRTVYGSYGRRFRMGPKGLMEDAPLTTGTLMYFATKGTLRDGLKVLRSKKKKTAFIKWSLYDRRLRRLEDRESTSPMFLRSDGRLQIGCQTFAPEEAAAIIRWAKTA